LQCCVPIIPFQNGIYFGNLYSQLMHNNGLRNSVHVPLPLAMLRINARLSSHQMRYVALKMRRIRFRPLIELPTLPIHSTRLEMEYLFPIHIPFDACGVSILARAPRPLVPASPHFNVYRHHCLVAGGTLQSLPRSSTAGSATCQSYELDRWPPTTLWSTDWPTRWVVAPPWRSCRHHLSI